MEDCAVYCMNVRVCGRGEKQDLIGIIITRKGLNICALNETKLKRNGKYMMGSIKCVKSGVGERFHAKEGVTGCGS
jgi:hypothetical protein